MQCPDCLGYRHEGPCEVPEPYMFEELAVNKKAEIDALNALAGAIEAMDEALVAVAEGSNYCSINGAAWDNFVRRELPDLSAWRAAIKEKPMKSDADCELLEALEKTALELEKVWASMGMKTPNKFVAAARAVIAKERGQK